MNACEHRLASPVFTNIDQEVLLVHTIGRGRERLWDLPTLACRDTEKPYVTAQRAARELLEVNAMVTQDALGEATYTSLDTKGQVTARRFHWFGAVVMGSRPRREHRPYYDEIDFMDTEALHRQLPYLSENAQAFYRQLTDGQISLPRVGLPE